MNIASTIIQMRELDGKKIKRYQSSHVLISYVLYTYDIRYEETKGRI